MAHPVYHLMWLRILGEIRHDFNRPSPILSFNLYPIMAWNRCCVTLIILSCISTEKKNTNEADSFWRPKNSVIIEWPKIILVFRFLCRGGTFYFIVIVPVFEQCRKSAKEISLGSNNSVSTAVLNFNAANSKADILQVKKNDCKDNVWILHDI